MGASVGSPSTIEVSSSPLTSVGSVQPSVLIAGLIAMRNGYLYTIFCSDRPLERATITYCLLSSSSRFARIVRIRNAVPAVPTIRAGIQTCLSRSSSFAKLHGAS